MREEVISTIPTKGALYFGVELELIHRAQNERVLIGKILDTYGHTQKTIYPKHDGTISNNIEEWMTRDGVDVSCIEWVTQPMTIESIKLRQWDTLFDTCLFPRMKEHNELGGHIHMSISSFSLTQLYKYMKFVRTNYKYIEAIGERSLNQWCKQDNLVTSLNQVKLNFPNKDRYEVLNRTSFGTLENRFFAVPRSGVHLYKNVEWCHALYMFCKEAPLHFSYDKFHSWLFTKEKMYPHIITFVKGLGDKVYIPNPEHVELNQPNSKYRTHNSYDDDDCDCECGDDIQTCEDCGCDFNYDQEGLYIDGHGYYCRDCFFVCSSCNEVGANEYAVEVINRHGQRVDVCEHCERNYTTLCTACGRHALDDCIAYDEVTAARYCPNCRPENLTCCSNCDTITLLEDGLCQECIDERNQESDED